MQSWIYIFNLEDRGKSHYPLWLELPMLPTYLRAFVDIFTTRFCKLLIPNGRGISFWANLRVCVEFDLKKKIPQFISLVTIDGARQ